MIKLIYISTAIKDFSQEDCESLLEQSREKNQRLNITGLLILKDRTFIQWLEGKEEDVNEVFETIKKDDRHFQVTQIAKESIEKRAFPEWHMGFKNVKNLSENEHKKLKDFNITWDKESMPKAFNVFMDF